MVFPPFAILQVQHGPAPDGPRRSRGIAEDDADKPTRRKSAPYRRKVQFPSALILGPQTELDKSNRRLPHPDRQRRCGTVRSHSYEPDEPLRLAQPDMRDQLSASDSTGGLQGRSDWNHVCLPIAARLGVPTPVPLRGLFPQTPPQALRVRARW